MSINYKQVVFIININIVPSAKDGKNSLDHVKNAIIDFISKLDEEDGVMIYGQDKSINYKKSVAIASMANFKHKKIPITPALTTACNIINESHNGDYKNYIYIITDHLSNVDCDALDLFFDLNKEVSSFVDIRILLIGNKEFNKTTANINDYANLHEHL